MHKYNIINLESKIEISTKTGTVKYQYDSYLVEYCIRKKYLQNTDDKFTTFLDLFKRVFHCKKKRTPLREVQPNQPTPLTYLIKGKFKDL